MQILTTSGYVNIEDANIGDQLIAYEVGTGNSVINTLLKKEEFSNDENEYYQINSNWIFNQNQSIWIQRNNQISVVHVKDLQVGDIVFNDQDQDIEIVQIDNYVSEKWWRLEVSGDHSYIADGVTLHNASRYWVGGGSSANWNATANTNWGSASGVQDNSSVPTSVDDVTFDGAGTAGNSNSTISATITIKSLNITTGYTSTMTHNAVLTIAGSWTINNTHTIAGTSSITLSATGTITSNGQTWPNGITLGASATYTLASNFTCSGATTQSSFVNPILNKTTSETWSTNGLSVPGNTSNTLSGTAEIILTGGTWSGNATFIYTNLTFAGNVTVSGNVYYGTNTLKYTSGTITTTGSSLYIKASCTINTSGISWNNVQLDSSATITLTSNFVAIGTTSQSLAINPIINRTTAETWSTNGISLPGNTGNTLSGTAEIILTGGTWSGNNTSIRNNLSFAGNVTVSTNVYYGTGILKYTSGTITTTGSTLNLNLACTLDTNGITWNNVNFTVSATWTINSLLSINSTLTLGTNLNITFAGTSGWTCATLLNASTQAATITLKDGNTYTINSLLDCYQSRVGSTVLFISSSATLKAILTLVNGASCKCLANFTRINASAGRTINTFGGTITNSDNIRQFYDLATVSYPI